MKRFSIVSFILALSFSFLFMCVGYAAITDELTISGSVENAVQGNVFITDIVKSCADNQGEMFINGYIDTTVNTTVTLSSVDSEVTYTISLHNNNSQTGFYYLENVYIDDFYTNNNISFRISMEQYRVIEKNGDSAFDITFYYSGDKNSDDPNFVLDAVIKFKFVEIGNDNRVTINIAGEEVVEYVDPDTTTITIEKPLPQIVAIRANHDAYVKYNTSTNLMTINNISKDTTIEAFTTFTDAINCEEGGFKDDTSLNSFLLINPSVEPTDREAVVKSDKNYYIDFNDKIIQMTYPLVIDGKLTCYEDDGLNGRIEGLGATAVVVRDKNAFLNCLAVAFYSYGSTDVAPYSSDKGATLLVYDGSVNLNPGYIHASASLAFYKRNLNAGVTGREKSSSDNTIVIKNTTIWSNSTYAMLIRDGVGNINLVNTKVQAPKSSAVVTERHPNETTASFDALYSNAIDDLRIYMTQGNIQCLMGGYHYCSTIHARMFYTSSVQFFRGGANELRIISNFGYNDAVNPTTYPVAVFNGAGNGEDNGSLDTDDWFYLKKKASNGNMVYVLNENGERARVGDKTKMISLDYTTLYPYFRIYSDSTKLMYDGYSGVTSQYLRFVLTENVQNNFGFHDYFMIIKSSQENYVNFVLYTYPDVAVQIEQPSSNPSLYTENVGIQLVCNRLTSTTYATGALDNQKQRFLIEADTLNTATNPNAVCFRSVYNTLFSYYIFWGDNDFNPDDPYNQKNVSVITDNTVRLIYAISNAKYPNYLRNRWELDFD